MNQEPASDKSFIAILVGCLQCFWLCSWNHSFGRAQVWHCLKFGCVLWMIQLPSVNISMRLCLSLTWNTANIEVCESPGQNAMRSAGTDKRSFSKNLRLCILFWKIRMQIRFLHVKISTWLWMSYRWIFIKSFSGTKELLHLLKSAYFKLRYSR